MYVCTYQASRTYTLTESVFAMARVHTPRLAKATAMMGSSFGGSQDAAN